MPNKTQNLYRSLELGQPSGETLVDPGSAGGGGILALHLADCDLAVLRHVAHVFAEGI